MTRIAMWTSLSGSSLMGPKQAIKDMGYTDIVQQTNSIVRAGANNFNALPTWGADVVAEFHAVGMKCFMGSRLHGLNSPIPFYYDWFDDANWNAYVKPAFTDMVVKAKGANFDGLAFDEELSGNNGEWIFGGGYPNPTGATKAAAEQKAFERGQQLNDILAYIWGGNVEVIDYSCYWPGGYSDWLQYIAGNTATSADSAPTLEHHFWRGWFSRNHHGHTWFGNANFYKGVVTGTKGSTTKYANGFAGAMAYDQRVETQFWPSFLNAGTDLSRIHITPMVAVSPIEHASTSFHASMAPSVVAVQLDAAARNCDGLFVDYHYGPWPYVYDAQNIEGKAAGDIFDYAPYVPGLIAARNYGVAPSGTASFPVTINGQTSSGLLTVTLS